MSEGGAKQHVDAHRKIVQRQQILRFLKPVPGSAAYVPFCGDGDLAVECYRPLHLDVYAADLDPVRTATAQRRMPNAEVVTGDCDAWPLAHRLSGVAVADLDSYAYPYHAWRSVRDNATFAPRAAVFFTDGQRQPIHRVGTWVNPDGTGGDARLPDGGIDLPKMRKVYNAWWTKHVKPWWADELRALGYREQMSRFYTRSNTMLYWASIIEKRR